MTITDPLVILIMLSGAFICASIGFVTGSAIRDNRARREQRELWRDAERLYSSRILTDKRDDTPLP